jgi:hypothetical protein
MQSQPCGYHGDPTHECRCTGGIIQRFMGKISGPLLDRIDLHIEVPAVAYPCRHQLNTMCTEAAKPRRLAHCPGRLSEGTRRTSIPTGPESGVTPSASAGWAVH